MNIFHFFHNALHLKPTELHVLDKMLGEPEGTLEGLVNKITAPIAVVAAVAVEGEVKSLETHNPQLAALVPVEITDTTETPATTEAETPAPSGAIPGSPLFPGVV